ncbi:tetratricopeptide repeat protein [Polynucleobacter sp. MWH-UH23A]|uniref:tetratricopeptide repeat protein n=1 Tax=Polynucleobacter sp. MWH-UH23A TaxID=1855613 RepID=UPI003364C120
MKMRNVMKVMKMFVTVFASALLLTSSLAFAEATLPEVSQAIQSGQLAKADAMMKEVLQNHPNSAKAHYIASELYLREGKIDAARQAFVKAENLAPGLPFAQPESVQRLQAELRVGTVPANVNMNSGAGSIFSSPMFWILMAILIAGIIFFMKKRQPPVEVYNAPTVNGPYSGAPGAPGTYPPGYPGAPSAGSGLMGSLATGAALGAGMVAGEALASHLMGGNQHTNPGNVNNGFNQVGGIAPDAPNFGVNDASSWDDAGASSWDDSGGGDFMSDV